MYFMYWNHSPSPSSGEEMARSERSWLPAEGGSNGKVWMKILETDFQRRLDKPRVEEVEQIVI